METSNSDADHAVLNAQNERWGLGPLETFNSGNTVSDFNAQNHISEKGSIETCNSDPKYAVLHSKSTEEAWDP